MNNCKHLSSQAFTHIKLYLKSRGFILHVKECTLETEIHTSATSLLKYKTRAICPIAYFAHLSGLPCPSRTSRYPMNLLLPPCSPPFLVGSSNHTPRDSPLLSFSPTCSTLCWCPSFHHKHTGIGLFSAPDSALRPMTHDVISRLGLGQNLLAGLSASSLILRKSVSHTAAE